MLKNKIFDRGLAVVIALFSLSITACEDPIIEKVVFTSSEDFQQVNLNMFFGDQIHVKWEKSITIKPYGKIFTLPWIEDTQQFQVGLEMDVAVFDDIEFANLDPVSEFPNGVPFGINTELVQISGNDPISDEIDIYGYLDLESHSWLGALVLFPFLNDFFPSNLVVVKGFAPDLIGRSRIVASVYGTTLDTDGNVVRSGGLAVLVNVRSLIEELKKARAKGQNELVFYANDGKLL